MSEIRKRIAEIQEQKQGMSAEDRKRIERELTALLLKIAWGRDK